RWWSGLRTWLVLLLGWSSRDCCDCSFMVGAPLVGFRHQLDRGHENVGGQGAQRDRQHVDYFVPVEVVEVVLDESLGVVSGFDGCEVEGEQSASGVEHGVSFSSRQSAIALARSRAVRSLRNVNLSPRSRRMPSREGRTLSRISCAGVFNTA